MKPTFVTELMTFLATPAATCLAPSAVALRFETDTATCKIITAAFQEAEQNPEGTARSACILFLTRPHLFIWQ